MDRKEFELQAKINELQKIVNEQSEQIRKLNSDIDEYKKKEQSISSAIIASIEHANQLEASRKKLYLLDIQRSRLMYLRMEQVINELYVKYPELSRDAKLRDLSERFKTMVYADLNDKEKESPLERKIMPVSDDPIKKLLHNIIDCFDTKKAPEIEKSKSEETKETPTKKDIFNQENKVDLTKVKSSSGFDFNEALHPTMGLDEIMKAFNLGSKKSGQ